MADTTLNSDPLGGFGGGSKGGGTHINPELNPPQDPYAQNILQGQSMIQGGQLAVAGECFKRAMMVDPKRLEAHYLMGVVLQAQGDTSGAIVHLERCTQLDPNHPDAYNTLGSIQWGLKNAKAALDWFEKALKVVPTFDKALYNIGIVCGSIGESEKARDAHFRAVCLNPKYFDSWQSLIFLRDVSEDSAECFLERRRIWTAMGPEPKVRILTNDPSPTRRLRVGYVSGDFWLHSAAFIHGGVILSHDWDKVHVVCYMTAPKYDQMTDLIRDHVIWRNVSGMDINTLGDLIQQDKIDILVDLSAFTMGTRLPVFRQKPAPVQVTAWGHAMGTGMKEMDYIFVDQISAPPDRRHQFVEQAWDLPALMCYTPTVQVPQITELPALKNGFFTFVSANRIMKLTDETWRRWGEILARVPTAQLQLKAGQFDIADAVVTVRRKMGELGVDSNRVFITGSQPHPQHVASYGQMDLGLDPWPHGGGVTTAEALFNGVPVVTQAGMWMASRTGATLNTGAGVPQFVTTSREEYIETAVAWAQPEKWPELAAIRTSLRENMLKGPVCDIPSYTRAVEAAYREMFRRWAVKRQEEAADAPR